MAEQRSSLVEELKAGGSISAVSRKYKVSRPTAYKWLKRSELGGGMEDRSCVPQRWPNRTPSYVEDIIVRARREYPCWGGRKLKAYLERELGAPFPSASTIMTILHRHGLVSLSASRAATPYKRFEREAPNELWQADFKGHFKMLDGNPWGDWGGYTRFEVFLMNYGVLPIHGRPFHPQTQGKSERFHRTLKRELLAIEPIINLQYAQAKFDTFRKTYNEVRPHCSLGHAVPAGRYKNSPRIMPKRIREWEYPQGTEIRNVFYKQMKYKGCRIYFSEAFNGCKIALTPSQKDGIIDVLYRNFIVAKISLHEKRLISKKS